MGVDFFIQKVCPNIKIELNFPLKLPFTARRRKIRENDMKGSVAEEYLESAEVRSVSEKPCRRIEMGKCCGEPPLNQGAKRDGEVLRRTASEPRSKERRGSLAGNGL